MLPSPVSSSIHLGQPAPTPADGPVTQTMQKRVERRRRSEPRPRSGDTPRNRTCLRAALLARACAGDVAASAATKKIRPTTSKRRHLAQAPVLPRRPARTRPPARRTWRALPQVRNRLPCPSPRATLRGARCCCCCVALPVAVLLRGFACGCPAACALVLLNHDYSFAATLGKFFE